MGPKKARGKAPEAGIDFSQESNAGIDENDGHDKAKGESKKTKEIKQFKWTRIINSTNVENTSIILYDGLEDLRRTEEEELEDKCGEI